MVHSVEIPDNHGDFVDDKLSSLGEIINSSSEIRRLLTVLVDGDYELDDRKKIYDLFKGKSTEKVGDILDAIEAGDMLDELEVILGRKKPSAKDIKRMRGLVAPVSDQDLIVEPSVICKDLGPDLIRRYFELLEGRTINNPYYFPLDVSDSLLEDLLRFEINRNNPEYQAGYIKEFIKHRHSIKMADVEREVFDYSVNITISFLRRHPDYQALMMREISPKELELFYGYINAVCSRSVKNIFLHLFGRDRARHLDSYIMHYEKNKKSRFLNKAVEKIRKMDKTFFAK